MILYGCKHLTPQQVLHYRSPAMQPSPIWLPVKEGQRRSELQPLTRVTASAGQNQKVRVTDSLLQHSLDYNLSSNTPTMDSAGILTPYSQYTHSTSSWSIPINHAQSSWFLSQNGKVFPAVTVNCRKNTGGICNLLFPDANPDSASLLSLRLESRLHEGFNVQNWSLLCHSSQCLPHKTPNPLRQHMCQRHVEFSPVCWQLWLQPQTSAVHCAWSAICTQNSSCQ